MSKQKYSYSHDTVNDIHADLQISADYKKLVHTQVQGGCFVHPLPTSEEVRKKCSLQLLRMKDQARISAKKTYEERSHEESSDGTASDRRKRCRNKSAFISRLSQNNYEQLLVKKLCLSERECSSLQRDNESTARDISVLRMQEHMLASLLQSIPAHESKANSNLTIEIDDIFDEMQFGSKPQKSMDKSFQSAEKDIIACRFAGS